MAVVSISRIQIRRGRRTELPQLASGEFGWSVDTQELYIGNGAVSEGAPAVGNTKLLSEHDDLFEYARNYTYKADAPYVITGPEPNSPIERSLQSRLDDIVSIRSFGLDLQRAVNQLFLNDATKGNPNSRVILWVEPGIYEISETIYIPPYATIMGSGKDKTIIRMTGSGPAFATVNGQSTPGNPDLIFSDDSPLLSDNDSYNLQARFIHMSGMTIECNGNGTGVVLASCRNSNFENIKIKGTWHSGDGIDVADAKGILLNSFSTAVTCQDNTFKDIEITNFSYGITSDFDIKHNSFERCKFDQVGYGIALGESTVLGVSGQLTGPSSNEISDSIFVTVDRIALWVKNGKYNVSKNNRYYNVGNIGGAPSNAQYANIKFETYSNNIDGDWFERTKELSYNQTYSNGIVYVPEVEGPVLYNQDYTNSLTVGTYGTQEKLFRLPANSKKSFEVDYIYVSNAVNATRNGKLVLLVDPVNAEVSIVDDYNFVGDASFSENLTFFASLTDENSDTSLDTVNINVLNFTAADDAVIHFRVNTKV